MTNVLIELLVIHSNTWNHLILHRKMSLGSFKNVIKKCVYRSYIFNMHAYKQDLALNNQQWLICHKNQPNQPNVTQGTIEISSIS